MDHGEDVTYKKGLKQHNILPIWGTESTMNLNPLILANIQGSSYFKVSLFKLKTYHEVIDEIYYQVKHLEPWERGSRKTAGQTGMCGGVRGVGAGGIVSTAFCLLYKLYTLRLTRKQVNGLLTHTDSAYIRALGFMYIRFTQPPGDLYDWYEEYLQDEEEIDVKAGGGQLMLIGQMLRQWLTKLDWFSTLFPRIPVPIQKQIESKLNHYAKTHQITNQRFQPPERNANGGNNAVAPSHSGNNNNNNNNNNNGFVNKTNQGGRRREEQEYYGESRDARERPTGQSAAASNSYRNERDDRNRGRSRSPRERFDARDSRDRNNIRDRNERTDRNRDRHERNIINSGDRRGGERNYRGTDREYYKDRSIDKDKHNSSTSNKHNERSRNEKRYQ